MKQARLPIAVELAASFETIAKPDGFSIVWERMVIDELGHPGVEFLVEGPFADGIEDGDRVGLMGSQTAERGVVVAIAWQWLDGTGRPVGPEIVVNLT